MAQPQTVLQFFHGGGAQVQGERVDLFFAGDRTANDAVHDVGAGFVGFLAHLSLGEILHLLVTGWIGAGRNFVWRVFLQPLRRIFDDGLLFRLAF